MEFIRPQTIQADLIGIADIVAGTEISARTHLKREITISIVFAIFRMHETVIGWYANKC